jgi:Ni,Fe-hydrogenase maturation factor
METKLERQARYLKTYIVVVALLCGVFISMDFSRRTSAISVDCISVSGKQGTLTLILSVPFSRTPERKEKNIKKTEEVSYPGMVFYN